MTLPLRRNFTATQCMRLKDRLELECGFRVGFLGLLLLSWSVVFRFSRIPLRHHKIFNPKGWDSFFCVNYRVLWSYVKGESLPIQNELEEEVGFQHEMSGEQMAC
jgi:hypothetical protein